MKKVFLSAANLFFKRFEDLVKQTISFEDAEVRLKDEIQSMGDIYVEELDEGLDEELDCYFYHYESLQGCQYQFWVKIVIGLIFLLIFIILLVFII